MILANKNAVIYGAGGSLGGAVAKAFANAGATVFLSAKNLPAAEACKQEIMAAGGRAELAEVDALDKASVDRHLEAVLRKAGTVDISLNAISWRDVQNIPLVLMDPEDFARPVRIAIQSHFLTATAAGRAMIRQKSGVILSLTATPGGIGYPMVGGFGPACCAIESFYRDLASEIGPYKVRVVNIRSGGSPDSKVFVDAFASLGPENAHAILSKMESDTMLKKLPPMKDIANTAVFLASDMAASITGVTVDVTAGTTNGLNYKANYQEKFHPF